MIRSNRVLFSLLLALTVLAFAGQLAVAGSGCKGAGEKGCNVKACSAKNTCVTAGETTKATAMACCADGKKCTKEECIKSCLAQGMTQEQAEEFWTKHQQSASVHCQGIGQFTKEECVKKCLDMGMTQEQAEECWAKHQTSKTTSLIKTASATSGCPAMKQAGATEACSKEKCIQNLMANGMSKEEAEAQYTACNVDGKCTGKCGGGKGCASLSGKK